MKKRERVTRAEILRIVLNQEPILAEELPDVLIVLRNFLEEHDCTVFAPGVLSHSDFVALLDKIGQHSDEEPSVVTPG